MPSDYLLEHHYLKSDLSDLDQAIKGGSGMIRFGAPQSPILMDALASLLLADYDSNAKQLAARAYLRTSEEAKDPDAKTHKLAEEAVVVQENTTFDALELEYKTERDEANRWYDQLVQNEKDWIDQGGNIDKAFNAQYYAEPSQSFPLFAFIHKQWAISAYTIFILVGIILLIVLIRKRTR